MPSFIEIEARKAQREADHIRLQQEEEANLREQERLEKEEEERLAKEAEEARLEEVGRQEEVREVVQRQKAQKEAEARARAEEVASSDEVNSVSGTIHIQRKRVMAAGELDMLRKVVGMDGSEWFPKIKVTCLRCKKRGEVCYWPLESKRPDGACHGWKGVKVACKVEEESQSEVPTKKAWMTRGKGKARATPTPTVAEGQILGLVAFFSHVDES